MGRRLYSDAGRFVGLSRLPNSLKAGYQAVARKTFGVIPEQPWIPFAALSALSQVVRPHWLCWEVGAGMSTLWLSRRVKHLTSIEANELWYDRLKSELAKRNASNVDLRFEWVDERMADFSELAEASLDFLMVDGGPRALCLEHGFAKVKPGGWIYLDNWDTKGYWLGSREFLSTQIISETCHFIDYVPGGLGVSEGLLLRV
jgi:hypothetical protein